MRCNWWTLNCSTFSSSAVCDHHVYVIYTPSTHPFHPTKLCLGNGQQKRWKSLVYKSCLVHLSHLSPSFYFVPSFSLCRLSNSWQEVKVFVQLHSSYMTIKRNETLSRSLCKNSPGAGFCWFSLYNYCASFSFMVKNDSIVHNEIEHNNGTIMKV